MFVLSVLWFVSSASVVHAEDAGTPLLPPISQNTQLMGKPLKIEQSSTVAPSGLGVSTQTTSQFLGRTSSIVSASIEAIPSTASDTPADGSASANPSATPAPGTIDLARTDLYIGGTRIWAGDLTFQKGGLVYSGGVAPTQIPFPILAYPLGPLMLEVDAGVEFEGDIQAALTPGLSYPLTDSSLDATLQAKLGAAGFIEGYGSIWLVRGGVEGRVDLIQGSTGIDAHLFMNGTKPIGTYLGKVVLLSGDVFGFVDTKLFFGKWNRILKKDFFKWKGLCYAFQAESCATN